MPTPAPALDAYFAHIQKECLPGVWSKGVALSRADAVQQDSSDENEIVLRVLVRDRPVSPKVTLWPADDDWFCDCGDRNEICAHVAASVIALKSGQVKKANHPGESGAPLAPRLLYRFSRREGALHFERVIAHAGREIVLNETLVAFAGGISSGRIAMPPIPATREDFAIDGALTGMRGGIPERSAMPRLLQLLSRLSGVSLDGKPVRISAQVTGLRASLEDAPGGQGFRLASQMDPAITEVFSNGAALCGGETLRPLQLPSLTSTQSDALSPGGKFFRSPAEIARLVSELLPSLEKKLPIEVRTERLPSPWPGAPKVSLRLEQESGEGLLVVAQIGYPEAVGPGEILIPDPAAEAMLARRLQSEFHLSPGQPARFSGQEAIDFALKLQSGGSDFAVWGDGARRFGVSAKLAPRLEATDDGFRVAFVAASAGASRGTSGGGSDGAREADPARVLQAWRDGAQYVPLIGGGWAPLPADWLARFGPRISALLEAREAGSGVLPRYLLPELAELCLDLGTPVPEGLRKLRERIEDTGRIPAAPLPADLRAELRDYQRQGVNWLVWLRDSGMGALLADDMGLGKTLQALCAIQGKTLVVCPTSVLSAWSGQIARFRPGLRVSRYHGSGRELDESADVTLTTYAVLRLDRERLGAREWDTLVLDEAQTIKNPASQVARAAHTLRGRFRIALSGTPVENRLEDLWSQFQFVNPGLLGSRSTFQQEFGQAIASGDRAAAQRLRARLKPFLLRRLKREVARELPPRTETVLHCELGESERELYDSILATSRQEVLQKLEQGASVFAALEMLLRLRQACCHPALVPGGAAQGSASSSSSLPASSSKVGLLLESLRESVDLGHRALVFSQWTGLLDLIEPALGEARLSYLRLDGATRDREAVVNAFQKADGPAVLLISLKAGGVGLTLTAADHVYLMDPWWNPAVEDQAADRAHRIGQENPVLIQRLVARDTVEDRILALQKRKQELAGAVLDGSGAAISLTKEDLLELLGANFPKAEI